MRTSPRLSFTLSFTERLSEAVRLAAQLHDGQRKKTRAPYLSHLLEVCSLVLQAGGDEDQAIAALLHDGPEKSGGRETLALIENQFGSHVAKMVTDCTDAFAGDPPINWRARKEQQVARFRREALPASCLVYAADKLANGREIDRRLRAEGPQVWEEYGGGREGHLWYFQAMYQVFLEVGGETPLVRELEELLSVLQSA